MFQKKYFLFAVMLAGLSLLVSCTSTPGAQRHSIPTLAVETIVSTFFGEQDLQYIEREAGFVLVEGRRANYSLLRSAQGKLLLVRNRDNRRVIICLAMAACSPEHIAQRLASIHLQSLMLNSRWQSTQNASMVNSLALHLQPAPPVDQAEACQTTQWIEATVDGVHAIPLCHHNNGAGYVPLLYDVMAINSADMALQVMALALSADGCIYGLKSLHVRSGETAVLARLGSSPPINQAETLMVVGFPASYTIPSLTGYNSCDTVGNPVTEAWLKTQFAAVGVAEVANRQWQGVAFADVRTVVNPPFTLTEQGVGSTAAREYTIADFDIRPYLPDDRSSSLYKVLHQAYALTGDATRDGIGYKQHAWSAATDAQNLAIGIDCSRAIWFAFSRSQLPYTRRLEDIVTNGNDFNRQPYIPTVAMVKQSSLLANNFARCDNEPLRLGDVLVYRRTDKDAGHVVMVIDPVQRIAWGSHGWDGNGLTPGAVPDKGAEFQLIKRKQDWQAWDRKTMVLTACWRYSDFAAIDSADIGNSAIVGCDRYLTHCLPQ